MASSMPAPSAATSATLSPSSQKSTPRSGEWSRLASGTYEVQPTSGTAPNKKLL